MKEGDIVEKVIIQKAEDFVKSTLGNDTSGHDWYHIDRVRRNAIHIQEQEQRGDRFIIEVAALLHDIPDEKLNISEKNRVSKITSFFGSSSDRAGK
jgi:uncharacterized protein